ncbi:MAG: carbohydrate binding family 9 domain-containing protein [Bacteroidota bacterium]|nr:carbohydrate binding family 9 domain-containing protein [Bacteroidota bacterium]
MNKLKLLSAIIILLLSGKLSYSQLSARAVRVTTPPSIDGHINDAAWDQAFKIDQFYQREPNPGEAVSEKTIVYICYDTNYLYFAVKCYDDPNKITAKEMARDVSLGNDDRVQIILDTYLDHRNGYWFQIGPRGSIGDALISENGASMNKEWDALWTGKSSINSEGWEAELAIPFKTIGFDPAKTVWGMKLIRNIKRKLEASYWPVANLNTHRFQISDSGILEGLEGITQGIGLDLSPYVIGGMNTRKGEKNEYHADAGLDMFYQVTPQLKASLSINTDFAETEVDDRQINLTRFNLHFPEKRDFFLDGSNYFTFGIEGDDNNPYRNSIVPFFSRRLGLDNNGNMLPVRYAAKITGQQNSWNIGMMYISDERDYGNSHLSVGRISHNLGAQSSIGVIGTWGNTLSNDDNLVGGIDLKLATSRFQKNKNLAFTMFGLLSDTPGKKDNNTSWGADIAYPNDFLFFSLGHYEVGENFVAGIGFVPRNNIKASYGSFSLGPRPGKLGILQVKSGAGFNYLTNFDNVMVTRELKVSPLGIRFKSGEEFSYSLNQQYELLVKDFPIFSGFIIPKNEYTFWYQNVLLTSAGSRNLAGIVSIGTGDFYNGRRNDLKVTVNYKVAVPLFIGANFTQNNVMLPEGNFTAKIYQLNANILFSPSITLYNYFQYDNATEKMGWQSRFQWILKPGNEIILAWTSGWSQPTGHFLMDESALRLKLKYNIRF